MLRLPIRPKLFSFIRNLTSNLIPAPRSFYFFKRLSISYTKAATVALESNNFSQDRAPVNGVHPEKSEQSKRGEGSGVKAIS